MAADSPNDQELALKKRARRRLVGAIALVLLMVIVLPMVLQDRSALAPQETIKITMPENDVKLENDSVAANNATPVEPQAEITANESPLVVESPTDAPKVESPVVDNIQQDKPQAVKPEAKPAEIKDKVKKEEKPIESKPVEPKPVEQKPAETKSAEEKLKATSNGSFTIQVGVFSDMENVKQLQAKLKQAGLVSRTENITTPKGEKIRLRAGNFNSRQEAAYALIKLQEANLTGMVISNN